MIDPEICPVCQSPKSSKTSGSLTQWVSTCTCDIQEELPTSKIEPSSVEICKNCGKRINVGRIGSFTQFIFRFDMCNCEAPKYSTITEERVVEENYITPSTDSEKAYDEIQGIQGFPYERFAPLNKLGDGSIGSVYQARDKMLNTEVAVKLLRDLDEKQLISFHQEAKATSKLNHPHIVKVIDFGISKSGTPYMVLQYLPGLSLRDKIKEEGKLDPAFSVSIICQVLEAIQCAHESGIYHRDIKPSNIILSPEKDDSIKTKLIDFGIARINDQDLENAHSTGRTIAGTPLYMSPDQGLGRAFDTRSETYSIGCVLFECLTGAPPFSGETALETLQLHAIEPPPSVSAHLGGEGEALDNILQKALAKEPDNRFQSAEEFRSDLSKVKFEKIKVPKATPTQTRDKPINRGKLIIRSSLILSLMFIPVIVYGVYSNFASLNPKPKTSINNPYELPVIPKSGQIETYDDESIEQAAWFPRKEVIRGHNLTDLHLKDLNKFPRQTAILISPPNSVSGEGFSYVKDKKRFTNIRIKSEEFNDTGAFYLSKFKSLRSLSLDFSQYITLRGIKYVLRLPLLKSLEFRFISPLPEGTFAEIARKKNLVRLTFTRSEPIKISDLEKLETCPKLKTLGLSYTEINDSAVPVLLRMKLDSLDITGTYITGEGLRQLAKSKTIHQIKLTRDNHLISQGDIEEFYQLNSKCQLLLFDEHKNIIKDKK